MQSFGGGGWWIGGVWWSKLWRMGWEEKPESGLEEKPETGFREKETESVKATRKMKERERGHGYLRKVGKKNNKKIECNEYFIEITCKINELMWVFCKSECIK